MQVAGLVGQLLFWGIVGWLGRINHSTPSCPLPVTARHQQYHLQATNPHTHQSALLAKNAPAEAVSDIKAGDCHGKAPLQPGVSLDKTSRWSLLSMPLVCLAVTWRGAGGGKVSITEQQVFVSGQLAITVASPIRFKSPSLAWHTY